MTAIDTAPSAPAYDAVADGYDLLTDGYAYDRWTRELERLALAHGLAGRRLLDVACGTGKSFLPFLERGYAVTACDLSAEMVRVAWAKAAGRARCEVADMRALPDLGAFDLVTCLGDALNHLTDLEAVADSLRGLAAALAPGGVLVFDLNTLAAYRDVPDAVAEDDSRLVVWNGGAARIERPGGQAVLAIDVFERVGELWSRSTTRQPHRHHPVADVLALLPGCGLAAADVRGQATGARLEPYAGEDAHPKAIVIARRSEDATERGTSMPFRP
jgi:SAM-dependent methyltransferase